MRRDQELSGRINEAIMLDDRVPSQPIAVSVKDGIVTLRGTVQTFARKRAAEDVAASCHGRRGVVNELSVVPPRPIPDVQVAGHVREALDAHADVTKEAITVSATDGVVSLAGTVGSDWERALAEDAAIAVRGVRDVSNLLRVNPREQIEDAAQSRNIQTALNLTSGLQETNLRVAVAERTAVLSGEVGQLWQMDAAEKIVRRFPVANTRNEIVVRLDEQLGVERSASRDA